MESIRFTLNGRVIEERNASPTTTLLNYVRDHNLTGTKEGCAEGDCGACSVAVLDTEAQGGPQWRAVNSCLVLLPMLQGKTVVTVEGLQQQGTPHPVQEALVQELGSQCGYCTPGVIMSMFEACYRKDLKDPSWKLDDQMCGNLCRCTGYRPIRDAARKVAGTCPADGFTELRSSAKAQTMALDYSANAQRYFNPTTGGDLAALLAKHPDARIMCGGTDLSLEITKKFKEFPLTISVEGIAELHAVTRTQTGVKFGAAVKLSDVEALSETDFPPLHRMLRYFASRQIKNRATLGGNICNASPIGDTAPVLMSLGASVVLQSVRGQRTVPLDKFFLAYRKTERQPDEFLHSVDVPFIAADARASAYKVSKRRELDISAVAAGFLVRLDVKSVVTEARLCFGGMAATTARALKTEAALIGKPWTEASVNAALELLKDDFSPLSDHRASAWYRATVAGNLLRGFVLETQDNRLPMLPTRPSSTIPLSE